MQLSVATYRAMGFEQLPEGEFIKGIFYFLCIYQIRGAIIDESIIHNNSWKIQEIPYKLYIGSSLNEIFLQIFDDDPVTDEEVWQEKHKCNPPYLVILFGPTDEHQTSGCYCKRNNNEIITYDSFSEAKRQIKEQGDVVLPSLISALHCSFNFNNHQIKFLPIDQKVFGKTKEGRTITDRRMEFSGCAYVSSPLKENEIKICLEDTIRISEKFDANVARVYHLALNEEDLLKKFLYFFLSIEIQTHATSKKIMENHEEELLNIFTLSLRAIKSGRVLLDKPRHSWNAIKDRFVLCVLCAWTDLSDSDVEVFKQLKAVRDKIAHGSISVPLPGSVDEAGRLAKRLLINNYVPISHDLPATHDSN